MSEVNNNTPNYDRLDSNGLLYLFQRLRTIFGNLFQAKESGKGLSTEDFTTAEKTKLSGIEAGAQVNTVAGVQVNGSDLTPDGNKKVNVQIPVVGVQVNGSDLTPDGNKKVNVVVPLVDSTLDVSSQHAIQNGVVASTLISKAPLASPNFTGNPTVPTQATSDDSTKVASTAFVKAAIAAALSGKIDLQFSFVEQLPASGVVGTFYFIPATNEVTGVDEFEEYVWNAADSQFERVGAATLDLTNYFNTTNLPAITNAQIDTILAT